MLSFMTLMINVVTSDPLAVANELRPALLRLSRELRKETESLGVTSRQVTLLWLIRSNPGLSLRELAAEERISAPALSGHVDRLENAGLIRRTRDEGDRRRVGLTLTEEGAAVLKRVRARRTSWLADRLKGLEPAELEAIEAALVPLGKLL
jgi:DNA-binding MarR family transcriptional regulator